MSFNDSWRGGGKGKGAYVLTPKTATQVPLSVDGLSTSGASDVLLRVRKSDGTVVFSVDNTGNLTFSGTGIIAVNQTVTGNLTVNGNTQLGNSVSQDTLTVTATTTFGGAVTMPTVSGTTTFSGTSSFNSGINVYGTANFNGQVNFNGSVTGVSIDLQNDDNLVFGTNPISSSSTIMQYDTAETVDAFKIGLDETSRHLIVCDYGDIDTNTTITAATNPTLYMFAANFAVTKYMAIAHNGTNGTVTLGTGDTVFSSGTIVGSNGYGINTNLGTVQGISAGGNITILSGASGSGISIQTSIASISGTSSFFTATSGANSGQTASTEELIANWDLSAILQFATGSLATQRAFVIKAPTYSFVGASTVTTNVVFQIDKASTAGTNATFTSTYLAQLGGSVTIGATSASMNYNIINVPAHTVTVTGSTQVTKVTSFAGIDIGVITITDASAVTIDSAAALVVAPPLAAGSVTLTNAYSIYATGDVLIATDKNLTFGTANVAATAVLMQYDTTQTNDSFIMGVDETTRNFIVCDYGDVGFNFAHTAQPSPTLFIHSAAQNTKQWTSIANDGTNAIYSIGQGAHTFIQAVQTSGTPNMLVVTGAAHTGMTLSTEVIGIQYNMSATKQWAQGALTTQREFLIQAPTYAFATGASTLTTAVTFAIDKSPTAGTNATFTNTYVAQFGGSVTIGPTSSGQTYAALNVPAHTVTVSGTTQVTTANSFSAVSLGIVTVTDASSVTVDAMSTLYIAGAVAQAGSVTGTKKYSLFIDAGLVRIDSTTANGSTVATIGATCPGNATVQEWFTIDINGTTRYIPCF